MILFVGTAQEVSLPADLRQHALTQYNSSLFNPTFSLDRNNPESVSFWTRWQWQNIDTDPTTLFLNYTRSLDDKSAAGAAFFQHNTGVFFNTGGVVNYAYSIKFNPLIKLSVGANLFGFVQELADDRFRPEPLPGLPRTEATNDFILQFAPGINLSIEKFSLGLASENLVDYNFKKKESNTVTSDKIFMGIASYDFPVFASDSTAYIRPSVYLRTIPEQENQIGVNALLSTQKYWGQLGYNNFYGISVGGGGTILNRFSLGAVLEFGTSASINSKDPSFEIIASYFLGKPEERREVVSNDFIDSQIVLLNEEATLEKMQEELEKAQALANGVEVTEEKESEENEIEEKEPEEEVTQTLSKKETRKLAAQEKTLAKEQRKDSIATVKKQKEALALSKKQEKEQEQVKYEEAKKEEALAAAQEVAKEQQRIENLNKEKEAIAKAEADKLEEQRKLDAIKKQEATLALSKKQEKEQELAKSEEAKKEEALAAAKEVAKEQQRIENLKKEKEAIAKAEADKLEEQRKLDAINEEAKKKEALAEAAKAAEEQQRLDAIEAVKVAAEEVEKKVAEEVVEVAQEKAPIKPEAGEKYEEVDTEDGLEPGFYLIANVFGTQKYFNAFMKDLADKGMQPKSFLRSLNNYNYAYLKRYDTMSEARKGRNSNFNGKYSGKTWIFRVVGK